MKAYLYNQEKEFMEEVECPIDPLESKIQGYDIYIQPAESTLTPPLEAKEGFKVKFNEDLKDWEYEEIIEEKPEEYIPTELDLLREELYRTENELQSLDYIGVKIATGRATIEEYSEQIARMNVLAEKVNTLEAQITDLLETASIMAQA